MRYPGRSIIGGVVFLALFSIFVFGTISTRASAAINPQINFQGKLTNPDGTNVTNGTYSIGFRIFTVPSGGSNVWSETQPSVTVTDGVFRVALGSITPLPGSVDFNSSSLYLGITVGADPEMTPRVQFTSAPYAFNSDALDGIDASGFAQLGLSVAQVEASTNALIFLNKTSSGNLLQLQQAGVDRFLVNNSGILTTASVDSGSIVNGSVANADLANSGLTVVAGNGLTTGGAVSLGGSVTLDIGAGNGITVNANDITLDALGAADGLSSTTSSGSGLEVLASGVGLLQGCADTQILKWDEATDVWACGGDSVTPGPDSLNFTEFADSLTLDVTTTIALGTNNFVTNLDNTGDVLFQDNGATFLTVGDTGSFALTLDATDNPTASITNNGSGNVTTNLVGTGDFEVQDGGVTFLSISDTGAFTYSLDATDNPAYSITNSGSSNVTTNLAGTGDFSVQDNGVGVLGISDAGAVTIDLDATDNPAFTLTNAGSSNVTTNLSGTGDYIIQDNGTAVLTVLDNGTFQFRNSADSATGFIIQDSAGAELFVIDTTNDRAYIGDPTADAVGAVLVLDTKNNAGDPTGVAGAMYYNSSTNTFRCFENGAWRDCLGRKRVFLTADDANNNGTANTLEDVIGMSFPVIIGSYGFECNMWFTSAAATTGSRWTINGPTTSALVYSSYYPNNATTTADSYNYALAAYNLPAGASGASPTVGAQAAISGRATFTAAGNVQVRFASEIAGSAITAKVGSWCDYWVQ